jgi:hypothetical protein
MGFVFKGLKQAFENATAGRNTGYRSAVNSASYEFQHGSRRRWKPEDRGFDSRWCHWNFSLT